MPAYQQSPINKTVPALTPGYPAYLLGSLNLLISPTRMSVTSVAIASNVATIGVNTREGNIPVVGQLVSVAGTTSASGAANVTRVAISGVSINATTGTGTISYAATGANQATTADSGYALAPQIEKSEALVNEASQEIAVQANTGPNNARTVRFDVSFPSLPTAATVVAQSADYDVDSEFYTLGNVATVAGGVLTGGSAQFSLERSCFVRFLITGVTGGTSPTIIAKVTV